MNTSKNYDRLPQFVAVVTDHNDGGTVLGRASASSKPLAASRAVRRAVDNLMKQGQVFNDKATSHLGEFGIHVYGQSSPAGFKSQYDALCAGDRYGV